MIQKLLLVIVGISAISACESRNDSYLIVKHDRKPTIVFRAYSNADTDVYRIKHGHTIIEAECGHEARPSWDPSDLIYFHCPLPVDKPLAFAPISSSFGGRQGLRYSENGQTTELAITSEEVTDR
jgi:hypothetical protein